MTENARRGYQARDAEDFSGEGLRTLQRAAGHVTWLMDQGYRKEAAVRFVGDHFQLSLRQREALTRGLDPSEKIWKRRSKRTSAESLAGKSVIVDGFNTVITLETAFSRGTLIRGRDGAVRDLAGLHGSYRIIPETEQAILLLFGMLKKADVRFVLILLQRQISNSGRLRELFGKIGSDLGVLFSAAVMDDPAEEMREQPNLITTNSVLMDRSESWYGLTADAMPLTGAKEIVLYTGRPQETHFQDVKVENQQ